MKEFKFKGHDNFVYFFHEKIKKVLENKGFEKVMESGSMESEKITEYKKDKDIYTIELKDVEPIYSEINLSGKEVEEIVIEATKKMIEEEIIEIIKSIDFLKSKKLQEFLNNL